MVAPSCTVLMTRYPMKFMSSPMKYGIERLIQMPASIVSSSTNGSDSERNVTSSTRKMAATAIRLTRTLSTATILLMS